jgi:cell division protein FtsI/penicillin-binding protein 2
MRVSFFKVFTVLSIATILVRLFFVQVLEHDMWVEKAYGKQVKTFNLPARRGEIYAFDQGEVVPMVMNREVWTVMLDPKMVKDEKKVEDVLSRVVSERIVGKFEDAWADKERRYFVIARGVSRDEMEEIKAAKLSGVGQVKTTARVYPEGELASRLLGFVNMDGKGQYGVEGAMNGRLSGVDGILRTVTDINMIPITIGSENIKEPAQDGENVVLTVDKGVQWGVEKVIAEAKEKNAADYVGAVVLNAKNGEVAAIAGVPNYNPEEYFRVADGRTFNNPVVDAPYEPASVIKSLTFATGLDINAITPETTYVNTGSTTVDDRVIKNMLQDVFGEISMQTALNNSFNTGSVEVLRRLDGGKITKRGRMILYDYFTEHFGLGDKTGIELYEAVGTIISPEKTEGNAVRYANMTFGQGMTATMMQVASGFASVVNGGEYFKPTIVAGTMEGGKFVPVDDRRAALRRTISSETSATMRKMLEGTREGRKKSGVDPAGYAIGGKSGTAEVAGADGRYKTDETIASYVGFVGGEEPEYVVMVRIEGAGKRYQGAYQAEPIFTEIVRFLVGYLGLKPAGA